MIRGNVVNSASSDISVIIPFYNREEYIDDAVQSVLAQTLKPLEIIIVNDCSRESSRRYLDRYADICRIIDLTKNVGLAGARNAGLEKVRGKFVALLDDDDIWLPRKLEMQRRYFEEHPGCGVVHTAVYLFFSHKPDVRYKLFETTAMPLSQVLTHRQWVIPSTSMFRTEVAQRVRGFDPWFRENEDRDFFIRCCAAGFRIEGIDEALVRFRRSGHSHLAGRAMRMYISHLKVGWKHRSLYYRVFGLNGLFNFTLESSYHAIATFVYQRESNPTLSSKIVNGLMWRMHQVLRVKYTVRRDYKEPINGDGLGQNEIMALEQPS